MSARTVDAELSLRQSVIKQQCVLLRLPTLASQCAPLAEQAERERQPYLGYLEALLAAELEERERRAIDRRIKDAPTARQNVGRVRLPPGAAGFADADERAGRRRVYRTRRTNRVHR